jgi:pheromone receptor transcription factor
VYADNQWRIASCTVTWSLVSIALLLDTCKSNKGALTRWLGHLTQNAQITTSFPFHLPLTGIGLVYRKSSNPIQNKDQQFDMADIADPSQLDHGSPIDDPTSNGDSRGTKRPRVSAAAADDDDDDDEKGGRERRKIEIKFIQDKSRRHITFSKRKAGIMKKVGAHRLLPILISLTPEHTHWPSIRLQAYELSVLTGTQVLLLVVSETGLVYTFTTPKLQPLVTKPEGKNLIQVGHTFPPVWPLHSWPLLQACLNAPEPASDGNVDPGDVPDSPEDVSSLPPNHSGMQRGVPQGGYMPQQQVDGYYGITGQANQYPGMPGMPQHQRAV